VLVLELANGKRRGLFIGLVNSGFTFGVSMGAVIAGALLPVTGWVSWLSLLFVYPFMVYGYETILTCRNSEIPLLDPIPPSPHSRHRNLPQHPRKFHIRPRQRQIRLRSL